MCPQFACAFCSLQACLHPVDPISRPVLALCWPAVLRPAPTASRAPCAQHEFIAAYSKVYKGLTANEYEAVWTGIDRDKNGELSLDELAAYYGYNMADLDEEEMSDDKILELLEVRGNGSRDRAGGCPLCVGSARPLAVPTPTAGTTLPADAITAGRDGERGGEEAQPSKVANLQRVKWV
jgi:hypothetical protein